MVLMRKERFMQFFCNDTPDYLQIRQLHLIALNTTAIIHVLILFYTLIMSQLHNHLPLC